MYRQYVAESTSYGIDSPEVVALVREEGPKVFMIVPRYTSVYTAYGRPNRETVIYDYSLKPGDTFRLGNIGGVWDNYYLALSWMKYPTPGVNTVLAVDSVYIGCRWRIRQKTAAYTCIQGLGVVDGRGSTVFPGAAGESSYGVNGSLVSFTTDSTGRTIFKNADYADPTMLRKEAPEPRPDYRPLIVSGREWAYCRADGAEAMSRRGYGPESVSLSAVRQGIYIALLRAGASTKSLKVIIP